MGEQSLAREGRCQPQFGGTRSIGTSIERLNVSVVTGLAKHRSARDLQSARVRYERSRLRSAQWRIQVERLLHSCLCSAEIQKPSTPMANIFLVISLIRGVLGFAHMGGTCDRRLGKSGLRNLLHRVLHPSRVWPRSGLSRSAPASPLVRTQGHDLAKLERCERRGAFANDSSTPDALGNFVRSWPVILFVTVNGFCDCANPDRRKSYD